MIYASPQERTLICGMPSHVQLNWRILTGLPLPGTCTLMGARARGRTQGCLLRCPFPHHILHSSNINLTHLGPDMYFILCWGSNDLYLTNSSRTFMFSCLFLYFENIPFFVERALYFFVLHPIFFWTLSCLPLCLFLAFSLLSSPVLFCILDCVPDFKNAALSDCTVCKYTSPLPLVPFHVRSCVAFCVPVVFSCLPTYMSCLSMNLSSLHMYLSCLSSPACLSKCLVLHCIWICPHYPYKFLSGRAPSPVVYLSCLFWTEEAGVLRSS